MLTIEDGDDTDARMDMLLGKKRASDRRSWLEEYGNMADIDA
jgi:topoisomerase-4 subunit B